MANGTIAFDTLQTSGQITGTAKSVDTDFVVSGSAKQWICFNGQGTVAINDSFNNGSVTDDGTGAYTLSFTNNFSNGNYSHTHAFQKPSATALIDYLTSTKGAGGIQVRSLTTSSSAEDVLDISCTGHGDLT